ncbi:hypothetical protein [Achromobacter arsenitoxydans]|nr:hypothetical protein [Achromobacter arsenitoxydans]
MSDRIGEAGGFRNGVAKAYSGAALDMAMGLEIKGDVSPEWAAPDGIEL